MVAPSIVTELMVVDWVMGKKKKKKKKKKRAAAV
jgi:hypothetical protein